MTQVDSWVWGLADAYDNQIDPDFFSVPPAGVERLERLVAHALSSSLFLICMHLGSFYWVACFLVFMLYMRILPALVSLRESAASKAYSRLYARLALFMDDSPLILGCIVSLDSRGYSHVDGGSDGAVLRTLWVRLWRSTSTESDKTLWDVVYAFCLKRSSVLYLEDVACVMFSSSPAQVYYEELLKLLSYKDRLGLRGGSILSGVHMDDVVSCPLSYLSHPNEGVSLFAAALVKSGVFLKI